MIIRLAYCLAMVVGVSPVLADSDAEALESSKRKLRETETKQERHERIMRRILQESQDAIEEARQDLRRSQRNYERAQEIIEERRRVNRSDQLRIDELVKEKRIALELNRRGMDATEVDEDVRKIVHEFESRLRQQSYGYLIVVKGIGRRAADLPSDRDRALSKETLESLRGRSARAINADSPFAERPRNTDVNDADLRSNEKSEWQRSEPGREGIFDPPVGGIEEVLPGFGDAGVPREPESK